MNKMRLAALAAMLAISVNAQQPTQPQRRDLSVKDVPDAPKAPRSVTPPRSYALIVGVAKYQNLERKAEPALLGARRGIAVLDPDQPRGRQLPRGERPSPDRS